MSLSKEPEKRARQLANLKPAKKGECRNPKGRGPSLLNTIIKQVKEEGYEVPKRSDIREALMICLTGNESQLKSMVNDKEKPMLLRIIARDMLGDNGFTIIEKLLDRTVGKVVDVTTADKPIKQEPLVVEVIDRTDQVEKEEET